MISDHGSICSGTYGTELGRSSYVIGSADGRLCCFHTGTAGSVGDDALHAVAVCRRELSALVYHSADGSRISAASYTVHNYAGHTELAFVTFIPRFHLDDGGQYGRFICVCGYGFFLRYIFTVLFCLFCLRSPLLFCDLFYGFRFTELYFYGNIFFCYITGLLRSEFYGYPLIILLGNCILLSICRKSKYGCFRAGLGTNFQSFGIDRRRCNCFLFR